MSVKPHNLNIFFSIFLAFIFIFLGLNIVKLALYPFREDPLISLSYGKAEILQVLPNSFAERSGLEGGDEIIELNGSKVDIANRLKADKISHLKVVRDNTILTLTPMDQQRKSEEQFGIEYKVTPQDLTLYELIVGHLNYLLKRESLRTLAPMTILGLLHAGLAFTLIKKKEPKIILTLTGLILTIIMISIFLYKGILIFHIFSGIVIGSVAFNILKNKKKAATETK